MQKPFYFKQIPLAEVQGFFVYTQLKDQTVLSQTTQLSMNRQFKFQTVLFDPYTGPYHVLPLQARVDLGAMAMKGTPCSSNPHHQIF